MKVINAGFERIVESSVTKKVERVARVCYKSEDLITEGSDLKMMKMLVDRQHYAMLEHASLVYVVSKEVYDKVKLLYDESKSVFSFEDGAESFLSNIRMNFTSTDLCDGTVRYIVSANLRGWLEFFEYCVSTVAFSPINDGWLLIGLVESVSEQTKGIIDFTEYLNGVGTYTEDAVQLVTVFDRLTTPERIAHEIMSVLFHVDRGVTHELVRMRDCSFAQESTRYCNYSQGKFGTEITVIKPCFWEEGSDAYDLWQLSCESAEQNYILLTEGLKEPAQRARDVLPQSVKADIVVTTNFQEWLHIFELRACDSTGPAHPQMKEVMCPLCDNMTKEYPSIFGCLSYALSESMKKDIK